MVERAGPGRASRSRRSRSRRSRRWNFAEKSPEYKWSAEDGSMNPSRSSNASVSKW